METTQANQLSVEAELAKSVFLSDLFVSLRLKAIYLTTETQRTQSKEIEEEFFLNS